MSNYTKKKGYEGEKIVANYYSNNGYSVLSKNYTIPGGEIDIIVENKNEIVFVEVKVVDNLDDIHGYIGYKKIGFLEKTIEDYLDKNNIDKDIRLDVVFIKDKSIVQVYENVTNN